MSEAEQVAEAENQETEDKVETPEGFVSVEDNQAQVNKQHRKYRDAERAAAKVAAENESLQQQLDELKVKDEAITVPDAPDPYSETYQADIAARDEAVRLKAEQDAQARLAESDEQRKNEAKVQAEEVAARENIAAFDARILEHGLNQAEIKKAADTMIDYGISDVFQDVLLEDVDGPLMVQYLADNPIEVERLNGMSALSMINHLNTEVRPKASLLKPKTSDAPDPPQTITGGGAKETVHPALSGVTYR